MSDNNDKTGRNSSSVTGGGFDQLAEDLLSSVDEPVSTTESTKNNTDSTTSDREDETTEEKQDAGNGLMYAMEAIEGIAPDADEPRTREAEDRKQKLLADHGKQVFDALAGTDQYGDECMFVVWNLDYAPAMNRLNGDDTFVAGGLELAPTRERVVYASHQDDRVAYGDGTAYVLKYRFVGNETGGDSMAYREY